MKKIRTCIKCGEAKVKDELEVIGGRFTGTCLDCVDKLDKDIEVFETAIVSGEEREPIEEYNDED